MDDFKKYMQQHAGEMDFEEPGEKVWKNIADNTKKVKQLSSAKVFLRLAAAACFIVLIVAVFLLVTRKQTEVVTKNGSQHDGVTKPMQATIQNDEQILNQPKADLVKQPVVKPVNKRLLTKEAKRVKVKQQLADHEPASNASVLQNIETNFSQLVNMQLNKVRSLPLYAEGPEYFSEFKKQFQQLEEDEKELKKAIQRDGLVNDNLDNLINVCQQKLNLLKLLQNEIHKTNSRYRQNNSDTTKKINHINI